MYGVDWDTLAKEIPTKEKTQIKNYYQNYKQRLELDQIELPHTAKHPKPSRGPSRASTPRPGGACTTRFSLIPWHVLRFCFAFVVLFSVSYLFCFVSYQPLHPLSLYPLSEYIPQVWEFFSFVTTLCL